MAAFPSLSAELTRRPVAWLRIAGWLCASVVTGQLVVTGTQAVAARPVALQPPPQAEAAAQPDAPATPGQRAQIEALQPWAGLVGQWRGVGQPTRGSNKGAWSETANWQWDLSDNAASLKLVVAEGKQLTGGHLRWLAARSNSNLRHNFREERSRPFAESAPTTSWCSTPFPSRPKPPCSGWW
jgi:hypothetical protein